MKKFSKVKYFGAVAAALLAVAPIAAPVVSQVASPSTVQAAAATDDQAWAVKALDNIFTDSATVSTTVAKTEGFYTGVNAPVAPSTTATADTILNSFLRSGNTADLKDANLSVSFNDYAGYSAASLAQQVPQAGKTSFQVTIKAVDATDASKTLASKVVTLNVGSKSSAAVTGATGVVGGATSSVVTPASMAAATKITDRDGSAVALSGADFTFAGWTNDPTATTPTLTPTASATFADPTTRIANDAGTVFANPGASYAVFKIAGAHAADKFKQVNFADLKTSYPTSWDDSTDWYIARPVNVTTGTDDQQYYPVFKYAYSTGTPATPGQTVNYSNGQTVALNATDAKTLTFYIGSTDQASDTANIAAKINSIIGADKSLNAVNSTNDSSALAPVTVTQSDVDNVITNAYKPGTYNIPVTAKNPKNGFSTTVYVPVTVNTTVGAPVAVSFTGYTEITKGSSFDPMTGIRFQNSPVDTTVIGSAGIKVSSNVDVNTPGTYTVTYTVTNTAGRTSTFTRTVKVVADNKTSFQNIDSVIYVQTSKSPQYKYDSATDTFTKDSNVAALPLSSAWKTTKKATAADGTVYYIVGGNGYLKASDVTTAKVQKTAGVVTVVDGSGVYTTANTTKDSGNVQYLGANTPWKYFAIATNPDGSRAYLVADNQWVSASSVVERVNSASGTFKVGSDAAPVFNGAGNVLKGQSLKAGSSWKVTGVKNINGKPYYRVSTDGYVRADYGSYKA